MITIYSYINILYLYCIILYYYFIIPQALQRKTMLLITEITAINIKKITGIITRLIMYASFSKLLS